MKDFIFSNTTKVYFGKAQLHHLSEEIAQFGKKVLLVYGGGSIKRIGLYDKIIAELNKAEMEIFELPGVEPNPHHTTVNKGAALCKKRGYRRCVGSRRRFYDRRYQSDRRDSKV
ncbi:iron-containing alcohol dehydrogenase [uncultured Ruminococcus sp.]|uniref:iron-containing alcohol dehydrogenase n=1 Tax=uncultured Ruminococcus sp. TaxID=165186 RepID=UPI00292F101A|nr:iron-containing alcohol dehydrogenase [uncultured Ruminococcus sp.]